MDERFVIAVENLADNVNGIDNMLTGLFVIAILWTVGKLWDYFG